MRSLTTECKCIVCGRLYVAGDGWFNYFICGPHCCAVRRAEIEERSGKSQEEEDRQAED